MFFYNVELNVGWRVGFTLYRPHNPRSRIANRALRIKKIRPKADFLFKLKGSCVKLIILTLLCYKVIVSASFDDDTLFEHHNNIGVHNR